MKKRNLNLLIGLTITASILSSCGTSNDSNIQVSTSTVKVGSFNGGYETIGTVQPQTEVSVTPKYAGKVVGTFKEVGDTVKAGDVLLKIDTTTIENQIKIQQASLQQANAGVVSANTGVEKAASGVNQANVSLDTAKNNLSTTQNGTNEQQLLSYKTALETAKNNLSTAQVSQQQASDDFNNNKALYNVGAISQVQYNTSKATLDKANSALSTAKTAVDTAQKNLDLYQNVVKNQTISNAKSGIATAESGVASANASVSQAQASVQSAQAAVNASETQLEILQQQLADYSVSAPIDGVIVAKNVDFGETAQGVVYTISNTEKVTITTAIPKEEVAKLSIGGKVLVYKKDGTSTLSTITALGTQPNAANLYVVKVSVDNKYRSFLTGDNTEMIFVDNTQTAENSFIVPIESLVNSGKTHYIFVNENNVAKKVFVEVLSKNSYEVSVSPIDYTLTETTEIITTNANMLKDGDSIELAN